MDAVEGPRAGADHGRAPEGLSLSWVDPRDEDELGAWFEVMERAARHGRDAALVWRLADLRAHLLAEDEDEDHLIAAARVDGAVVGTGSIDVPLRENLDSAILDVNVAPDARGRGIGSAILAFLEGEARRRGRTRLEGETVVVGGGAHDRAPGVRFAARHAFAVANTEDHLVLALPATVGEVVAPAGYTLVDWQGRAPREHAEAYARMRSALSADVPSGELGREPEVWDLARLRAWEQRSLAQGRVLLVSAAVTAGGAVVGHTTLSVLDPAGDEVFQGDTYVMAAHRGRGLGRALKERNLARLGAVREGRPGLVHTWTAEVNAPMTAINRALGFRVAEVVCELERRGTRAGAGGAWR